jgi:hypothetical protein
METVFPAPAFPEYRLSVPGISSLVFPEYRPIVPDISTAVPEVSKPPVIHRPVVRD